MLLSATVYGRLRPHLTHAPRSYRQSLYAANKPVEAVYFIETGVGSLVNTMSNRQAAEVGAIGNEGLVGLPIILGESRALTSVCIPVPGEGLSMPAARFRTELAASATIRAGMLRHTHAFLNQVAHNRQLAITFTISSIVAIDGC